MAQPRVVDLPETVYRIGRVDDPLRFSSIRPDDAVLPKAGNRYDVAGGAVLYAASQVRACYGETISRFRTSPKMRELLADEEHYMRCGGIPRDWRLRRTLVTLSAAEPAPFLDVDDAETQAFLSVELAPQLLAYGYEDNLDLSTLRNSDRRLSRAIALWAYTATDDEGLFRFSGIRYASRILDSWENWAIFDGTEVYETSHRPIEENDPDLRAVAGIWDLVIH